MTVPTKTTAKQNNKKQAKFPVPRNFWIMRIPSYVRGKDPTKYKPSRADATPLACIGQSASKAKAALATLQSFAKTDETGETHFIAVFRSEKIENKLAQTIGQLPKSTPINHSEFKPATMPVAQMVVSWDGYSLKCEMAGDNGSRIKIEDALFSGLDQPIRDALEARLLVLKDRARAEFMETQRENVAYVASARGMGIGFARHIWKDANIASRTLRARLAKAGQYDPISGKIRGEEKREKEILDIDI